MGGPVSFGTSINIDCLCPVYPVIPDSLAERATYVTPSLAAPNFVSTRVKLSD